MKNKYAKLARIKELTDKIFLFSTYENDRLECAKEIANICDEIEQYFVKIENDALKNCGGNCKL